MNPNPGYEVHKYLYETELLILLYLNEIILYALSLQN